ncbi:S8 family serine peptidase [Xanthomonas nasturtii]|uniref:S8 family peptidase n=1 Tax=Xanthomonas TaxID=338 RepID=UPI002B22A9D7|nr:S8 family serine peptidase [Xanthomonas nasturtii]MEA9556854.1 S8 family serine peptidase [Xanthomonas nasturtii]
MTVSHHAALLPRRLLLTLRLGEVPEHLPGLRAVQGYGTPMSDAVDHGPIDRLLRHHGDAFRAVRLHSARLGRQQSRRSGAQRFDAIEQLSGVARVLRVELRDGARLPALLRALAEIPVVERVGADYLSSTPRTLAGPTAHLAAHESWAQQAIRLPQALQLEPGDPAVLIGLADTGVALQHPELAGHLRAGFDSVDLDPATVGGLSLVGDYRRAGERPQDEVGHGTGCAGILVASGRQIAPGGAGACGLTPARVLGAALEAGDRRVGVGALDNIDAGMKRLIDLGVKVINMSFGTPESALLPDAPAPHEETVRYALARGVVLVAASGNSGLHERFYPAAHDGVIAVGGIDAHLVPASFSTRGAHVALCAPGRDIRTCALDGYQSASGTSFAAPFVAAACGLLAARAQRRAWPLDGATARQLLCDSARPFGGAGVADCGAGVLDAHAALRALDAYLDLQLRDEDSAADSPTVPASSAPVAA